LVIAPTGTNESGPAPYPVTVGPCGLSGALSDTAGVALRSEMELGAKRTRTVHVPPGATGELLQVVPTRKSPGYLPVDDDPPTTSGADPTGGTGWGRGPLPVPTRGPPKAIEPGVIVTSGPGPARNSSALVCGRPSGPLPPVTSTCPSGSRAAAGSPRAMLMAPGDTQMPPCGWSSSATVVP